MTTDRRIKYGIFALSLIPPCLLAAAFLFINHFWPFSDADYERYRKFWGGNPSEVFSHWLDMVVMSGNTLSLAWLLTLEAFAWQRQIPKSIIRWVKIMLPICLLGSIGAGVALDARKGEGTVLYASLVGFLPVLGSWYYLMRKAASFCKWVPGRVLLACALYIALSIGAQLVYEPSGTGGPNVLFIFVWLGSIVLAAVLALFLGVRSGSLRRFGSRTFHLFHKPIVWGSLTLLLVGISIPLTVHARRLRQPRQAVAMKWLDDIESSLSDDIFRALRSSVPSREQYQRMAVPQPARTLMTDSRIGLGNSLRIYVPVTNGEYLFLWANNSFDYCDIRPLKNSPHGTVEIDQGFIDTLRERQGTCQSGLYSALWSPYLAGRVLKTQSGEVKAICVIKCPD
jgi:hypothetical protein